VAVRIRMFLSGIDLSASGELSRSAAPACLIQVKSNDQNRRRRHLPQDIRWIAGASVINSIIDAHNRIGAGRGNSDAIQRSNRLTVLLGSLCFAFGASALARFELMPVTICLVMGAVLLAAIQWPRLPDWKMLLVRAIDCGENCFEQDQRGRTPHFVVFCMIGEPGSGDFNERVRYSYSCANGNALAPSR
jgi:hypothetical protein